MHQRAVILLSGGLDSTTCLAIAIEKGLRPICLTFSYGQRHDVELMAAKQVASYYGVEHLVLPLPLREIAASSLTGQGTVPKDRDLVFSEDIPSTYVPARNMIFLSCGIAYCETLNAPHLFFGANSIDYSGYPDCRPEFLESFQEMAAKGTKCGAEEQSIQIHAPLITLSKADIVCEALRLGVPVDKTFSCYDPDQQGRPCGCCDACRLREKGFSEAKLVMEANPRVKAANQ